MLKSLNIENIAVIEKADIEFSKGLNVLTGETGAGKSIVVDSINAILGERTSRELVRHGAENANVTAMFDNIDKSVCKKLEDLGLNVEEDGSLLINRKISAYGKSSCRINGSACTVSMLKEIGALLVNIHGQHDSQALLNPDYHYKFIDMLSDDENVYVKYHKCFKELIAIRKRLKILTADADTKDRQLELLNYQIDELTQADVKIGEIDQLKARKNIILNSQNIANALNSVIMAVNGDDEVAGIQSLLSSSSKEISSVQNVDDDLKEIHDSLESINDRIEAVKDAVSGKLNSIDFGAEELEKIDERLDILYHFQDKYGNTEQEMLDFLTKIIEERNSIVNSDEEIEKLNAEYDKAFEKTVELADELSNHRKQIAKKLESDVKTELEFLDMPKTSFIVSFDKGNLSSNGYDKIEFLISTNPGEPPKLFAKIASGGELSRTMLAIKNIIASNDVIDTLIFDEIDTGVSGRASRKIGLKLKSVSSSTQVICVTHSAQIASVADNHLLIEKKFDNNRTFTGVKSLDFEGRKQELARIMGGLEITESLLNSAQELLNDVRN